MRERLLDLVFLLGVLGKGLDGLAELVGGLVLLVLTREQLMAAAVTLTAEELAEDPHDVIAHLVLHGVSLLDGRTTTFIALYLLLHGVVKLAIVVGLVRGSLRIYPWAILGLGLFLVVQLYELAVQPSAGVVVLSVIDALLIALTWREWRHGRTLHETMRSTVDWVLRR